MNNSILKPVIAGVLIGAALFFMPFFVLRVAVIALIIGLLFRLFAGRRYGRGFAGPGFADRIRNMSDEEYAKFKERFQYGCGGYYQAPKEAGSKS